MNTTNKNSIAFGAPGSEPRWASSVKDGTGTACHSSSCIWFTLSKADFQGKLLSAMRYGFGGHVEKSAK
jgi:6-phosphogluconate dehydrogenase (decarboxylating)